MGIFSKKETILGVDIGTASLKVCELLNDRGKPTLSTYGLVTLPNKLIEDVSDKAILEVVDGLEEVLDKSGAQSKKAVAALPGNAVYTLEFDMPHVDDAQVAEYVSHVIKKHVEIPESELTIDWDVVEEVSVKEDTGKMSYYKRVLLTAAPTRLVTAYMRIFEKVGLELVGLETESIALVRSLVGSDKSPILVLDMGARTTDICLVDAGFPRIARGIVIGGDRITRSIAQSLSVNTQKAEQFKKDFGLRVSDSHEDVPEVVRATMDMFVAEVQKVLSLYAQKRNRSIEKIILTGGSARLKGLGDYLERTLSIKVYAGNPWARVVTPAEIHDSVKRIGPEFAVAIGLAMRDI